MIPWGKDYVEITRISRSTNGWETVGKLQIDFEQFSLHLNFNPEEIVIIIFVLYTTAEEEEGRGSLSTVINRRMKTMCKFEKNPCSWLWMSWIVGDNPKNSFIWIQNYLWTKVRNLEFWTKQTKKITFLRNFCRENSSQQRGKDWKWNWWVVVYFYILYYTFHSRIMADCVKPGFPQLLSSFSHFPGKVVKCDISHNASTSICN